MGDSGMFFTISLILYAVFFIGTRKHSEFTIFEGLLGALLSAGIIWVLSLFFMEKTAVMVIAFLVVPFVSSFILGILRGMRGE